MGWPKVLVGPAVGAGQAPQLLPPFPEGSTPQAVFASAGPGPAGPTPGGGGLAFIVANR